MALKKENRCSMPARTKAKSQERTRLRRKKPQRKKPSKEYKFVIKPRPSSKVLWWKTQTHRVATINDIVNNFEWNIYVGPHLQPAIDDLTKSLNINPQWTVDEYPGRIGHFFAYKPYRVGGIWFEKPPKAEPGLVAHECFHAVMYLVEMLESKITEEQEEFVAYYLGFLVDQVHKLCKNLL